MNNSKPKKQHTIPKVFLKKFCPKDKEGNMKHNRLQQFDKVNEIFSERTTDKIMVKNHFYTMEFQEEYDRKVRENFFVEHFLSNHFESSWNNWFQKIYTQKIGDEDWINVCAFISQIISRSEYLRDYIDKMKVGNFIKGLPNPPFMLTNFQKLLWEKIQNSLKNKTYLPDSLADLMELFLDILVKMKVDILYIEKNQQQFITADIPFVLNIKEDYIFIPVSNTIALYFYDYDRENDFGFFGSRYINIVNEECILRYNAELFHQAKRFVFFNEDINKDYILKLKNYSGNFFG